MNMDSMQGHHIKDTTDGVVYLHVLGIHDVLNQVFWNIETKNEKIDKTFREALVKSKTYENELKLAIYNLGGLTFEQLLESISCLVKEVRNMVEADSKFDDFEPLVKGHDYLQDYLEKLNKKKEKYILVDGYLIDFRLNEIGYPENLNSFSLDQPLRLLKILLNQAGQVVTHEEVVRELDVTTKENGYEYKTKLQTELIERFGLNKEIAHNLIKSIRNKGYKIETVSLKQEYS